MMVFSEQVKKEVKERAAFRCCRCQSIGVEIHHIIPQEYGGSSEIDNAAPLCPSCHDYFGGNPDKRKEIRHMRDWWYKQVKIQFPDNRQIEKIEKISIKLDKVIQNQMTIEDFKQVLFDFAAEYTYIPLVSDTINKMTLRTIIASSSAVIDASASPSASPSPEPPPSEPEEKPPS